LIELIKNLLVCGNRTTNPMVKEGLATT